MRNYIMRLETRTVRDDSEVVNNYEAELNINDTMRFSDSEIFSEQIKEIWQQAMRAGKRNDYMEMEVIVAAYRGGIDELKEDMEQMDYDRWVFRGHNQDADGIYLWADREHTPAERTMYLTKDVLNELNLVLG